MNQRKKIIISVLSGLFAVAGLFTYLQYRENLLLELATTTLVVTAKQDIPQHRQLDETMLTMREVPKKYVQPGALFKLEDALGQVVAAPILKEEQIVGTKLLRFGRETGLAMKIPAGMRAMSLLVNDVTGVAGLIQPNNFVDVLGTFDFGDETKSREYTYTLYQNVQVLAVNEDLGEIISPITQAQNKGALGQLLDRNAPAAAKTITLAVTPEQAQSLVLAQETGTMSVALRSLWESDQEVKLEPATAATLTGLNQLMMQRSRPRYREYRGKQ